MRTKEKPFYSIGQHTKANPWPNGSIAETRHKKEGSVGNSFQSLTPLSLDTVLTAKDVKRLLKIVSII